MLFLDKVNDLLFLFLGVLNPDNFIGMLFILVLSSLPLYLVVYVTLEFYRMIGGYYGQQNKVIKRRHQATPTLQGGVPDGCYVYSAYIFIICPF